MQNHLKEHTETQGMTRRKFLWLTSMSTAGLLTGCAVNPVTGERQFMAVSEASEVQIDQQHAPHQFSSDYGVSQDSALNHYVDTVGKNMASVTHRPKMPYSFQPVNATYVNAYAFPGGTIAATRGILLKLDSEAELAALLGHELGHVNARHTAQRMSKGMLISAVLGLGQAYVQTKHKKYAALSEQLGMLGAGMLLASYSRDNEREADALGNQYMVQSGYSTKGFVGLMDMLKSLSKNQSNAVSILFSTHPMSSERYRTAIKNAHEKYQGSVNASLSRERYMDHTAKLRYIQDAIENMQKGEAFMAQKKYHNAETNFKSALKKTPRDYAGLVMMSKCLFAQDKHGEAQLFSEKAKQVYPQEAQAYQVSGLAKLQKRRFASAFQDFKTCDRVLPGNPNLKFFKGFALEGMGKKKDSANEYKQYLQSVNQGDRAKHAYTRLVEWGVIKKKKR